MTTDELYERVCSVKPLPRADFEEDLTFAVRELCTLYGEKYVLAENAGLSALPCREDYAHALCSAVLYTETGSEELRELFLQRGNAAFLSVWRRLAEKRKGGEGA